MTVSARRCDGKHTTASATASPKPTRWQVQGRRDGKPKPTRCFIFVIGLLLVRFGIYCSRCRHRMSRCSVLFAYLMLLFLVYFFYPTASQGQHDGKPWPARRQAQGRRDDGKPKADATPSARRRDATTNPMPARRQVQDDAMRRQAQGRRKTTRCDEKPKADETTNPRRRDATTSPRLARRQALG